MSKTIKPAAIRKSFTVRASREKAFEVFTKGFDRWWPRSHYIGPSPLKEAILEPGVGGRWYSVHEDGSEQMWGDVLAWNPPGHLIVAWRISKAWGYDPNLLTEVEVTFTDVGAGQTLVDFEHRGLERFGDSEEADKTRAGMDSGWGLILENFKAVVGGSSD